MFKRNMWEFALTFLLATSALSADFNHLSQQNDPVYPIDADDDFFQKDYWVGKPNNLIFNFEQIRRDQPPQIEQRNENLGRYMYRKKMTTTEAAPVDNQPMHPLNYNDFNVNIFDLPKIDAHRRYPEINTHQWNSYPSSIPPAPSTPKWEAIVDEDQPKTAPQTWNIQPELRHYELAVPSTTRLTEVKEYRKDEAYVHSTSMPLYVPEVTSSPVVVPPAPSMMVYTDEHENRIQHKLHQPRRGSYRFKPSDMTLKEPTSSTTTTLAPMPRVQLVEVNQMKSLVHNLAASTRAPLPPVPTLSPWYDGFGK